MKVTITSIQLRSPFKFFPLSLYAMRIMKQLKTTNHLQIKTKGLWTRHYTMTLWKEEKDLKEFAYSGAHRDAMKKSRAISREIRTLTYEADALPDWKTAIRMLSENGKVIRY